VISVFNEFKTEPVQTFSADDIIVKHPIGVTEFIKIGDHEIKIHSSPHVPPGEMWVVSRGKIINKYINVGIK